MKNEDWLESNLCWASPNKMFRSVSIVFVSWLFSSTSFARTTELMLYFEPISRFFSSKVKELLAFCPTLLVWLATADKRFDEPARE
ncbi:hypothetical protein [Mesomycoplasma ovipneumoniae]|uniref:hypothetical protein n=1 Tax=Mesomycoplasma ovipneumoniae TaxID=29562 RepID=UPI0028ADA4F5|nr:hypothetical protein [Mesomycoplasma ovipneumoniae]WNM14637.1 hypothetical protein RNM01_02720 [Mesomycoplasma ovipneumoniae]